MTQGKMRNFLDALVEKITGVRVGEQHATDGLDESGVVAGFFTDQPITGLRRRIHDLLENLDGTLPASLLESRPACRQKRLQIPGISTTTVRYETIPRKQMIPFRGGAS